MLLSPGKQNYAKPATIGFYFTFPLFQDRIENIDALFEL